MEDFHIVHVRGTEGLFNVLRCGETIGQLRDVSGDSSRWKAWAAFAGGELYLVGDFAGPHARERAYRRVRDIHRARDFVLACLECPAREETL